MVKHVTVRMVWHDSKWNGNICNDPQSNVYCRGNYSLLSPRIQRRIKLDDEEKFRGQRISEIIEKFHYYPPCYWSINLLGKDRYTVRDMHPLADAKNYDKRWLSVPPLDNALEGFSVFTWNFKLGYAEDRETERYVPEPELEKRVNVYADELQQGRPIAFFYANFSNPITGDKDQYLLLGAGIVNGVRKPQRYQIPDELLSDIRSRDTMHNFPTLAWQLQLVLDPSSVFVLPYHEYLEWVNKDVGTGPNEKWKKLDEIAIPITESTLIPHFKYVSMHLSHDKCLYLLYLIKKSYQRIKDHKLNLISYDKLAEIGERLNRLLTISWAERGQYPGFLNLLRVILANDFSEDYMEELLPQLKQHLEELFGGISQFVNGDDYSTAIEKSPPSKPDLKRALEICSSKKDFIRFLSRFDFSIPQFKNVLEKIVKKHGLRTIMKNPYILLEEYHFDVQDGWNIDHVDYGIDLFQIDIALIPDPAYAKWGALFNAESPERLRAVVSKILNDASMLEGSSCLGREEIVKRAEQYPLYYIVDKLRLDTDKLEEYERQAIFKEQFIIKSGANMPTVYQLRSMRDVEDIIEQFINRMLKERYELNQTGQEYVKNVVNKELKELHSKLDVNERRRLYEEALCSGLFVVSGKAGSGKTSAIVNLVKKFREDGISPIFVFTPTGKASLVIRDRLKQIGLGRDSQIRIFTIHRFLYTALLDYKNKVNPTTRSQIFRIVELAEKILKGRMEFLDEFKTLSTPAQFPAKVVIIDEASMVDEIQLALLFSLISLGSVKHLIIAGDEKQLPPIGVGRPFVDTVFYLKKNNLDTSNIRLESNLRFDSSSSIATLSDFFGGDDLPSSIGIEDTLNRNDGTVELKYFHTEQDLQQIIVQILTSIGNGGGSGPISEMFAKVFGNGSKADLEKVQILTPRRVGSFGSMVVNVKIIRNGNAQFSPRTKVICEENKYFYLEYGNTKKKILALANGSIGYLRTDGSVYFEELDELKREYGDSNVSYILRTVQNEISDPNRSDRDIDFGYAITVHKAQGSDFEHVIFILSEINPFITKELLYTALTRPRSKLYLVIHDSLRQELPLALARAYENSAVEQRKTLLFEYKSSPFKPYIFVCKNGKQVEARSKVEYIISNVLDELDVEFEYEPKEFLEEHRLIPDFKISINGRTYYLEHLGAMKDPSYRNRWYQKFEVYKKLGVADILITTSESEDKTDIKANIKKIVDNIKSGTMPRAEVSYSYHHYFI
jgi:exodeoxyribonuclease V alpha subunit